MISSLAQVYSLMGKRLRALCSTLDISDERRLKIWTCFEYSLVHCTDIMVDRHLDQLLLCAIYVISKVGFDRPDRGKHAGLQRCQCLGDIITVGEELNMFLKVKL